MIKGEGLRPGPVLLHVEERSADSTSAAFSTSLICCFNWSLLPCLTSGAGCLTQLTSGLMDVDLSNS